MLGYIWRQVKKKMKILKALMKGGGLPEPRDNQNCIAPELSEKRQSLFSGT